MRSPVSTILHQPKNVDAPFFQGPIPLDSQIDISYLSGGQGPNYRPGLTTFSVTFSAKRAVRPVLHP